MITTILYDLGGVLVRLRSDAHVRKLIGERMTREQFWSVWAHSPAMRAHETGKIDAAAFAQAMVRELEVEDSPEEFLRDFSDWIVGPFEETAELLRTTHARYQTALLTNTSALHWPVIESLNILPYMHHVHASFQVGMIKPDLDYFETALSKVGCRPEEALFFDDSALNVAAAQSIGIDAHRVDGAGEVLGVLMRRGL